MFQFARMYRGTVIKNVNSALDNVYVLVRPTYLIAYSTVLRHDSLVRTVF